MDVRNIDDIQDTSWVGGEGDSRTGLDRVAEAEALLASDDPSMHRAAINLLMDERCDPRAPRLLAEAAREHRRPQTRGEAVQAMGRCRDAGSVVAVIAVLGSDVDAGVRLRAASILGVLGDSAARPALEAALRDSDEGVRVTARRALDKLR